MISLMIARLESETENFTTIEHAWDTEPVDVLRDIIPALFLFPGDESTEGDGIDYLESKRVHIETHVYIVCDIENLEARKTELRTALIGWTPSAVYTDLALISGKTVLLKGGLVWWEDVYRSAVTIREQY